MTDSVIVETLATVVATALTSSGVVLAYVRRVVRTELRPLVDRVEQLEAAQVIDHREVVQLRRVVNAR